MMMCLRSNIWNMLHIFRVFPVVVVVVVVVIYILYDWREHCLWMHVTTRDSSAYAAARTFSADIYICTYFVFMIEANTADRPTRNSPVRRMVRRAPIAA